MKDPGPAPSDATDPARVPIHFLVPDRGVASQLGTWDPDADPTRFASGAGHSLLELAVRAKALRPEGITWGPRVPPDRVVVVYAGDLCDYRLREYRLMARLALRPSSTFVLIRSDLRMSWTPLVLPDLQFVPNRALTAELPNAVFLPPLPQRGLLPRDPGRGDRLETVAIKSNPENVPAVCESPEWRALLQRLGLRWVRDVPGATDGSDQRWHDFRDVDVVVSLRPEGHRTDMPKPPTRLINAWRAGAIPLANDDVAVREIGTPGQDVIIVKTGDELLAAVERLAEDEPLRASLFEAARRRGTEFDPGRITALWLEAIAGARARRRGLGANVRRVAFGLGLLVVSAAAHAHRRILGRRAGA